MALVVGNTPGRDLALLEDKIKGYRNFATKLWNIARFVLANHKPSEFKSATTENDKTNLAELSEIKKQVTAFIEEYDFNQSANAIYHYVWHTFADKIIEDYKARLASPDSADRATAQETLLKILRESLKMLHPFMPFITEEIWGMMPGSANQLIIEKWQ